MNIFTRNMNFVKYNNPEMDWVKFNGVIVYESWKTLTAEGVPPITLLNCKGANLLDYKIYGKTEVGTLPAEYQQVEYIESDGNQHIDTGLEGKNGYTMNTKVVFTDFPNSYGYVAGFGTSSSNRIYFTRAQKNGLTDGWTFDGNSHNISSVSVATNTEYVYKSIMEISNQKLYRNGVLLDSYAQNTVNSYGTVWLFAANYNGGINGAVACKMYYCQFTYDGELVRDFVPCYRKSDGVVGMYDMVEGVFYTNNGSGEFTKGANVNPTPSLDNCVEIYGVGDKTKNMLDIEKLLDYTNWDANLVSGGSYPTSSANKGFKFDALEVGEQYTISMTTKGTQSGEFPTYLYLCRATGGSGYLMAYLTTSSIINSSFTFTAQQDTVYFLRIGNSTNETAFNNNINRLKTIELKKSPSVTDYEPYGYKIPVKVGGKNLLPYPYRDFVVNGVTFSSQNNKLLITGTPTATFWGNVYTFTLPAGQYTLVENSNLDSISGHSIGINNGSTALVNTTVAKNRSVNFELTSNSTLTLTFRFTSNIEIPDEELELMIINRNDSTNFVPYIEPISSDIILNEPLRKIDNNVDYIDFENSKEVRNVEEITVTGNERGWEGGNNMFRFRISESQLIDTATDFTKQICNYAECKLVTISGAAIGASVYYSSTLGGTYFRIRPENTYTIDSFKDLLINLNSSGKPLKICYPKLTPTEQTIELPNIRLNKGQNTISVDTEIQPSNMYVKYKGKQL